MLPPAGSGATIGGMRHNLIYITWHDAHSPSGENWISLSDLLPAPCVVETVGWLIEGVLDNHLVVAQSYNDSEMYDNLIAIPAAMVVSVRNLLPAVSNGAKLP